jgi:hypothetical protein
MVSMREGCGFWSAGPRSWGGAFLRKVFRSIPLFVLLGGQSASATLLLSSEHRWGVATSPEPGWVIEYYLCDDWGENCDLIGTGDTSQMHSPIRVDHTTVTHGRLRARFCPEDTLGSEAPGCSGLSEAGPLFVAHPALDPDEILLVPDELSDWGLMLVPGIPFGISLPLAVRPPLSAELRLGMFGSEPLVLILLGPASDRWKSLYIEFCQNCSGDIVLDVSSAVEEAAIRGEQEIVLTLVPLTTDVLLVTGDPVESGYPAPHIRVSLLPSSSDDVDGDGVPEDGDGSGVEGDRPCWTGQRISCDDNCPDVPNPGQEDDGGFNTNLPDGVGNACQLGDVDGNGIVDNADAMMVQDCGYDLPPCEGGGPELLPSPDNCDVSGDDVCNLVDATIIHRNLAGLTPCADGVSSTAGVCDGPTLMEGPDSIGTPMGP